MSVAGTGAGGDVFERGRQDLRRGAGNGIFFDPPNRSKTHQILPKSTTYDELTGCESNSFCGRDLERNF